VLSNPETAQERKQSRVRRNWERTLEGVGRRNARGSLLPRRGRKKRDSKKMEEEKKGVLAGYGFKSDRKKKRGLVEKP